MLEEQIFAEKLMEHTWSFLYSFIFSVLSLFIAWQKGFFQQPFPQQPPLPPLVRGKNVIKGFLTFILVQAILLPAVSVVFLGLLKGADFQLKDLDKTLQGWLNLSFILGGFLSVFLAFFNLSSFERQAIWGRTSNKGRQILMGILTWFISYPVVIAIGQLVAIAVLWLFRQKQIEQVAVRHIKSLTFDPWLFSATVLGVCCLVPILEEFLFRGLLQSWIKKKLGHASWTIVITSIIFALFHYSTSQGVTNIELLSSLFLLSCFLGFLYERQRSLWAPIGLHGFFNAMSILMIINR
jgi:membrane protease YdiL (CAAX protease family)